MRRRTLYVLMFSVPALLASVIVSIALWGVLLSFAYIAGRRQEAHQALHVGHVAMSAGATVLLVLVAAAHQWGVGNIGAPGDGVVCSRYCRGQGFAASSMPPRDSGLKTCSCLDARGRAATTLPMAEVAAQ